MKRPNGRSLSAWHSGNWSEIRTENPDEIWNEIRNKIRNKIQNDIRNENQNEVQNEISVVSVFRFLFSTIMLAIYRF